MDQNSNIVSLEDRRREYQNIQTQGSTSSILQPSGTTQTYVGERPYQQALEEKVASLDKELREMKEMIKSFLPLNASPAGIINLRDIPYSEAKEEIAEYFRKNDGREIGYEELIEELQIEPKIVIQACNELLAEGKIG